MLGSLPPRCCLLSGCCLFTLFTAMLPLMHVAVALGCGMPYRSCWTAQAASAVPHLRSTPAAHAACRFIKWTQETFSAGGHKAELLPLLERCTRELQVRSVGSLTNSSPVVPAAAAAAAAERTPLPAA